MLAMRHEEVVFKTKIDIYIFFKQALHPSGAVRGVLWHFPCILCAVVVDAGGFSPYPSQVEKKLAMLLGTCHSLQMEMYYLTQI